MASKLISIKPEPCGIKHVSQKGNCARRESLGCPSLLAFEAKYSYHESQVPHRVRNEKLETVRDHCEASMPARGCPQRHATQERPARLQEATKAEHVLYHGRWSHPAGFSQAARLPALSQPGSRASAGSASGPAPSKLSFSAPCRPRTLMARPLLTPEDTRAWHN